MTVEADRHPERDDRIIITFPYDANLVNRVKQIEGRRFVGPDKGGPYWHLPLTLRACYALREQFGNDLVVGRDLANWARNELAENSRLGSISSAEDAELLIDNDPRIKDLVGAITTRRFQRPGVRFLTDSPCPLLADEQGLGKTLQAIAAIFESGLDDGPMIIVCPKSAMSRTWERELCRWQPHPVFVAQGRTAKHRQGVLDEFQSHEGPAWLIVNPGMIQFKSEWQYCEDHVNEEKVYAKEARSCEECQEVEISPFPYLHDEKWRAIICDEVHRNDFAITNPKTKTARSINALKLSPGGKRIAMSGTPMRGRAQDLFGVLKWLTSGTKYETDYRSRWQWMERYVESEPNQWAKSGKTFTGRLRSDREMELFEGLRPYVLRRKKREVASDLPDKDHIDVWCDMEDAQDKQYQILVNDGQIGDHYVDGVLSELTRSRQIATSMVTMHENGDVTYDVSHSGKVQELLENLENSGVLEDQSPGPDRLKVVVATQWARLAKAVAARLADEAPGQVEVMTGATSQKERNRIVKQFQEDSGPSVLVMTTETGGVSITLDRADTLHVLDETWEPTAMEQLEDRLHRLSRTDRTTQPVTIYTYRSKETIDSAVYMNNLDKTATQKLIMDDRRSILRPDS